MGFVLTPLRGSSEEVSSWDVVARSRMAMSRFQKVVIAPVLMVPDSRLFGRHRMRFEILGEVDKTPEQEVRPGEKAMAGLLPCVDEASGTEALRRDDLEWNHEDVRTSGLGRRIVTDGPFAETKH